MERHYIATGRGTAKAINDATGIGVMMNDRIERRLLQHAGRRQGMVDIERETKRAIFKALADGRKEGESTAKIGRRIRQYVPAGRYTQLAKLPLPDGTNKGVAYRADMIARAESKTAQNVASMRLYKEHPNVNKLEAYDTRHGDTHDPACVERDGKVFTFEEAEGEDLTHPNCSLSWGPVVE